MKDTLMVIQIIVSVLLSGLILLQAKGVGLGRTSGFSTYHTKRGVEKLVFRFTIVIAVSFVAVSIANYLV